jgi:hypothetical protein
MPHYLLAGQLPEDFDPSTQDEATVHAINVLNDELEAAGVRIVAGGLSAPSQAKSLRLQPDGGVLITDGPYLEAKEHVGGLLIIEAAGMDEALAWGRKSVIACRMPLEVREIPYSNLPSGTAHPSRLAKSN